ncbi:hypothetical protein CHLRE_06g278288v5 [Chlamydomonas reinhardtii]|uniref:Uncharacterized protein n=1 Tax=Chlamydomonas reinhardtii TaxID=3055 RepID=A0A2K3DPD5_CHLRE|nr:uncharacterized protein CHLRE_06g278288v5 [Chlamydomonas reinhardtii]PNW82403.1 hypothetical protein CHLRE_06g278288v5 [Chlamydomonas reinhardtii]
MGSCAPAAGSSACRWNQSGKDRVRDQRPRLERRAQAVDIHCQQPKLCQDGGTAGRHAADGPVRYGGALVTEVGEEAATKRIAAKLRPLIPLHICAAVLWRPRLGRRLGHCPPRSSTLAPRPAAPTSLLSPGRPPSGHVRRRAFFF